MCDDRPNNFPLGFAAGILLSICMILLTRAPEEREVVVCDLQPDKTYRCKIEEAESCKEIKADLCEERE